MTKKTEKRKHFDGETETKSKKVRTSENHDLTDDSLKKSCDSSLSSICDMNRSKETGIKPKKKKGRRSENADGEKNVDNIENDENNSVITPDHELPIRNDHIKKSDKESIINDNVTDIDNMKELSESKKKKTYDQSTDKSTHIDFQNTPKTKKSKKLKKKTKEKFDDSTSSYSSGNDLLDMSNESKNKKSDDKMDQSSNSNTNIEKQNLSKVKKCKKAKKKKQKDKLLAENNDNVEKEEKTNEKSAKELAVLYLKQWKKHREEWKFQKVRQVWLLTHMYDSEMVSDKDFKTLLKYLDGLKGMGRQTTSSKAQNIVESESDDAVKIDRARQIVQQLSTE